MAKQTLPTNFTDDILNSSMGGKRRYNLIQNSDGTVSLEDVTDYTQVGSDFGSAQINQTNHAVNESCDKADVIDDIDDIVANQANGKIAGAKAVATLNADLSSNIVRRETSLSLSVNANQYKAVSQPQTSVPGYTYFLGICGVAGAGSQNIVPYRAFATNLSDTFGVTNVGGVNTPSAELRIVQIFVKKFIDEI